MSGGSFRGRSFAPHEAHYNNSRSIRRDDGERADGLRDVNDRNFHNFPRDNFESSSSLRCVERFQNENWSTTRRFTRWDQPLNNRPLQPSPSVHNQPSPWLQNRSAPFHNRSVTFQHHDDTQQFYNRGGHGYFPRGGYRFSNPRGPQNFYSSYYSVPFRENAYNPQNKEVQSEEPQTPLLGSEEERQQKITEAADELKRKLLSASSSNDELETSFTKSNDNVVSKSPNSHSKKIKSVPSSKSRLTQLNYKPSDLKDNSKIVDNSAVKSIDICESNVKIDKKKKLKTAIPTHDDNIITNSIARPTLNKSKSNADDKVINKQIIETNCTVGISIDAKNSDSQVSTKSHNESSSTSFDVVTAISVAENSIPSDESAQIMRFDKTSNTITTIVDPSNNIKIPNTPVPDSMITNPSILGSLNAAQNPQVSIDGNISSQHAISTLPKKRELNLIEFLQEQVELSKNKSPHNTECGQKVLSNINHNYSEPNILRPPPLPPELPQSSYKQEESSEDIVIPEFDSRIHPSNLSNACGPFQQSSSFNNHLSSISPIMSTSIANPPMNISMAMPNYAINHQSYVSISPYGPGISLPYSAVPTLDYIQTAPPPLPPSPPIQTQNLQHVYVPDINEDDDVLDDLKQAMEFANQCMVMGNDANEVEDDVMEFPTFPDLPPITSEIIQPQESEDVKPNVDVINPRLKVISEANEKNFNVDIEPIRHGIECSNEMLADEGIHPTFTVEANSKLNISNKNDELQMNKSIEKKKIVRPKKCDVLLSDNSICEIQKKIDKLPELLSNNNITKSNQHPTLTRFRKLESINKDENLVSNDKISASKVQLSSSSRASNKIMTPKSLNESSWKDRVIGRFLKMSKNDIQNMINNSSLRKFDIAMQHLVKEKRSSLSLEMRNHEDEKMKISTYDNEDFMSQLQAILNPAATVDLTNLPTNFIHQLSEVLHLDPLPSVDMLNSVSSEKQVESIILSTGESSMTNQVDRNMQSDSSRHAETNSYINSNVDIPKLQKIDNKVSKDTVKNVSSAVYEPTTCSRTKLKCGFADNKNIQQKTNEDLNKTSAMKPKTIKTSLDVNSKIAATPSALNKTLSHLHEPIPQMNIITTTSTMTSMTSPRIDIPISTCMAQQAMEIDKLFNAGISKAKAASTKDTTVNLTIDEVSHGARTRKMSRRNDVNVDTTRNIFKEECTIHYGKSLSPISCEEEFRKADLIQSRKIMDDTHENISHINQKESNEIEIGSQYDNDTSNASSSSSSSEADSSQSDVTKVLKFIKEREKIGKPRTINEEIRDEVTAEIEKHRKEKSTKQKLLKSQSKKRDKREKEQKFKKNIVKKIEQRKTHSKSVSANNTVEQNAFFISALSDNEIKYDRINEDLPSKIEVLSRSGVQRGKTSSSTEVSSTKVTSPLKNKTIKQEITSASLPFTKNTMPTISSAPLLMTSSLKTSSPQLSVEMVNTVANTSVSAVVPLLSVSTTKSAMGTVSTTSLLDSSRSLSPILQPKTKAQLKQMPEATKSVKNHDSKMIEPKIFEPVSSTSEHQIISPEKLTSSSSPNVSFISSTSVTTTPSKPRKLDIKAYHERTLQRKLKQEKTTDLEANPTQLTENLLALPIKSTSLFVNGLLNYDKQSITSATDMAISTIEQPCDIVTTSSPIVKPSQLIINSKPIELNDDCYVPKVENTIELNVSNLSESGVMPAHDHPEQLSTPDITTMKIAEENITANNKEVFRFKSECGKELKLREKMKKRTQVIASSGTVTEVTEKTTPNDDIQKIVDFDKCTEEATSNLLSPISIAPNSLASNCRDNNLSENIETDVLNIAQKKTNESEFQVNDGAMVDSELLKPFNYEKDSTHQSESIVKKAKNNVGYQGKIPIPFHYVKLKDGVINDKLPDIVAQEKMYSPVSTQVPIIVENKKIIERDNIHSSASKSQHENEITTSNVSEMDITLTVSEVTKNILTENEDLEDSQNTDDLLEVMVPPDVVSDLFKEEFDDIQLSPITPIVPDNDAHSPLSRSTLMTKHILSEAICKHCSTKLLNSIGSHNTNKTQSNHNQLCDKCESTKSQCFDQVALDESSDISMKESTLSDPRELSEEFSKNTDRSSHEENENDGINILTTDPLLLTKNRYDYNVSSVKNTTQSWVNYGNIYGNSKEQLTLNNDALISNDDLVSKQCCREPSTGSLYSPQIASTSNNGIVYSSSIPDKELMAITESISVRSTPQVSSEMPKNSEEDNNINTNSAISIKVETGVCNNTANKLNNVDQRLIESPTSTTRIIEMNLSGREDNDRSSLEKTHSSVKQIKAQNKTHNLKISREKCRHSKGCRDDNSTRRSDNSKSAISIIDYNKPKKDAHGEKKQKLTLKHIEEAITANIVNITSKPTTKDDVISRMQEIDITIQELMNEKMRLYEMLQIDKWPVTENEETTIEVSTCKTKSHSSSDKANSIAIETDIELSLPEILNVKNPSTSEISLSKSELSNFQKNESSKSAKPTIKNDNKRLKKQNERCVKSKKKKHHRDETDSYDINETKRNESLMPKKQLSSNKLLRQNDKASLRVRNFKSEQRKPTKLSQILAGEFKPKITVEKCKSEYSTIDKNISMPKADSEIVENCMQSATTKIIKSSSTNQDSSDETDSDDLLPMKNTSPQDNNFTYSDESSLDTQGYSPDKHEWSTGLSLLEQSIKREITAKKIKLSEPKKKSSLKQSRNVSTPLMNSDASSLKAKQSRTKLKQDSIFKISTKTHNHTSDATDLSKNDSDILHINTKIFGKKQKSLKKNEKQLEADKNDSETESKHKLKEKTLTETRKNQNGMQMGIGQVKSTIQQRDETLEVNKMKGLLSDDENNKEIVLHDIPFEAQQSQDVQNDKNYAENMPIMHDNTLSLSEQSTMIGSTIIAKMKPDRSAGSEKKELVYDSLIEKHIDDSKNEHSSIEECDEKSKKLKSSRKDIHKPKSKTKKIEKPKLSVTEIERPKSTVKEVGRSKSIVKEFKRSKSMVKELEEMKSSDDSDDNSNNISTSKKRGRPPKSEKRPSSRSSRPPDDIHKNTARSHKKDVTNLTNVHDQSMCDIDQNRPSTFSFSSSVNCKPKSYTDSHSDMKIDDKNNLIRRGQKRKNLTERTIEQMKNCKVRLVDCKNLYLRSDLRSDIYQRLGISKINTWTPLKHQETTPERPASKLSSIIFDDDKIRSDNESMEIIQVDDNSDLQSITSPEWGTDMIMGDPLSMTPQTSPQLNLSLNDDKSEIISIKHETYDVDNDVPSDGDVEVLHTRTLTPVNNGISSAENDESEAQIMQYTVHKGPILDIKIFGDSFLAASEDGSIYRYCQKSNGILNIYKGHDAAVTCLHIHEAPGIADSDNTRWNLFSGSLDATLRCYDIINGSLDRHVANAGSPIQCMDQSWGIIFIGTKSGHISRYDIKSGCLREDKLDFSDKPVLALRASTEGARRVLIVASRNQPITIRDAQNGLYLRTISGQRTHTVYSLLRDHNLVYCGTSSTSIPVFDFISGEQVIQYTAGVGIVCMRLYQQLLFAGCYDGNIYVFDIKDNRLICSIPGPGNMLLSMEIVGDKIIAGSKDRRLCSWRMPSQARIVLTGKTAVSMCLCLGPAKSGKTLLMKKLQGDCEIDDAYHTVPTNGINLYTVRSKDGHFDMIVREIGGSMAPIWKHYFEKVHKIIYVVDASNLCQISAAGVLLYSLLVEPKLQHVKICLVLSKMDLSYRQMRNEALLMLHFTRLKREVSQNITLIETSGMEGLGVEELREWLFDPETLRAVGSTGNAAAAAAVANASTSLK